MQDSTPLYILIYNYQDSKLPFLLKDVIVKEDESDCLFNQQSTAYSRTNSDISFQYEEHAKPEKIANQYQIDMLLLNRSQQLNQIKGWTCLEHCLLETRNLKKLWLNQRRKILILKIEYYKMTLVQFSSTFGALSLIK